MEHSALPTIEDLSDAELDMVAGSMHFYAPPTINVPVNINVAVGVQNAQNIAVLSAGITQISLQGLNFGQAA
jgi:hypothetical protein